MSHEENSKIDALLQKFDSHARETKEELSTIKRGIYGDPLNKVPGLIDTDKDQDRRIKELEEQRKKQKYTMAGIGAAAGVGLPLIIEWVKKQMGL